MVGRSSQTGAIAAMLLLTVVLGGCADESCPGRLRLEEICSWQMGLGSCRVGHRVVTSSEGLGIDAELAPGETLSMSLVPFSERLREVPDLLFKFKIFPPWPADAVVAIDGVVGTHFVPNPERREVVGGFTSVRWAALPEAPVTLTIRYDWSEPVTLGIQGWFEDGPCEDNHPEPRVFE